jgi:50S ribosomal subunit-associated GTPase HflX
LLHIIDASDPYVEDRVVVVHEILHDIWAHQQKILIFNKIDLIDEAKISELQSAFSDYETCFISVKDGRGLEELKQLLIKYV